jgi:hypothetical protein
MVSSNYTVATPFAFSKSSIMYVDMATDAPPFLLFEPFSATVWVAIAATFVVTVLSVAFVRRSGPRRFPVRDAALSTLGYSRLFEAEGHTPYEDCISIFTAMYSVLLLALYSSNLVARGYISEHRVPDLYAKPMAYDADSAAKWFMDVSGYVGVGVDMFDQYGRMNSSFVDGILRGEYYGAVEDVSVSSVCNISSKLSAVRVPGVHASFVPLVRNDVPSRVFDAFVYDSNAEFFYVGKDPPCLDERPAVVGLDISDAWSMFAILAVAAAALVLHKIAVYKWSTRTGLLPRDSEVIDEERGGPTNPPDARDESVSNAT